MNGLNSTDYVAYTSFASLVLYGGIRLAALVTRTRRANREEGGTEFDRLYRAQGKMLDDCHSRCRQVEDQLLKVRQDHALEIVTHRAETKEWHDKYVEQVELVDELQYRIRIIEDLFRRTGLGHLLDQAHKEGK